MIRITDFDHYTSRFTLTTEVEWTVRVSGLLASIRGVSAAAGKAIVVVNEVADGDFVVRVNGALPPSVVGLDFVWRCYSQSEAVRQHDKCVETLRNEPNNLSDLVGFS